MQEIALNQAATSSPKAPGVAEAMLECLQGEYGNPGREASSAEDAAGLRMLSLREKLCAYFTMPEPECCFFMPGATWALNQALKGYLRPGDHVLVSGMEHNAVMRPLSQLAGVIVERVPCGPDGAMEPADVASLFRPDTRLVCMTHASNVCGTILPLQSVGEMCAQRGVAFVVDAAQVAGHRAINGATLHADAIAVPAHKGLLGPQGVGALLTTRAFAQQLVPLAAGGTGSRSESEVQPELLPDKLESGTLNLPGIYGWDAAMDYLTAHEKEISQRENALCEQLWQGLREMRGLRVLGTQCTATSVPVVSVDFFQTDNAIVAEQLALRGIHVRCGLHCAPAAHRTLGTFPQGTVRFSIGWQTTPQQIDATLRAVYELTRG